MADDPTVLRSLAPGFPQGTGIKTGTVSPKGHPDLLQTFDFGTATGNLYNTVLPCLSISTVAAWIIPQDNAAVRAIVGSAGGTGGYLLRVLQSGANANRLNLLKQFVVEIGTGATSLTAGTLWHVAATYNDVTGAWALYVNGMLDASGTNIQAFTAARTFTVGRDSSAGASNDMRGEQADVRIWNRILTPAEIWQIYDPRTCWDLYYPLRQRVFSFPNLPATGFNAGRIQCGVVIGGGCF